MVGGGVIGLTLALELRRRHPASSIIVIDKEERCGLHASGRNSGVIHAGFYYTADSLKARLTRDGNRRLTAWCEEHGVAVRACGKLVVARDEVEHARFDELLRRAEHNGVTLQRISAADARNIEPRARTFEHALWSPSTAAVDPRQVMAALVARAEAERITICTSTRWIAASGKRTRTSAGPIDAGFVVNAAGVYADEVARAYGFAERFRMLPFRGVYLYAREEAPPLRTHIYPVPDLDMPFLGVHFTVTADGHTKIGPTAVPAWWLENYGDTELFDRFDATELAGTLWRSARLFARDPSFRRHAKAELAKLWRPALVRHAAELLDGVTVHDFDRWGSPGIRAQLYDNQRGELVMDFLFEGDERSMHVLNAVSPAFTCSLAFAEHVVDAIEAA